MEKLLSIFGTNRYILNSSMKTFKHDIMDLHHRSVISPDMWLNAIMFPREFWRINSSPSQGNGCARLVQIRPVVDIGKMYRFTDTN